MNVIVCYYDKWKKIGENLILWKWFATEGKAESYAESKRAEGDTMFVLGKRNQTPKKNNSR